MKKKVRRLPRKMNNKKSIEIKYSTIKKVALIYITLPLFCFFIGWLKLYFAIPAVLSLIVCIYFAFKKMISEEESDSIFVSKRFVAFLIIISFLYCFLCGIGRLWAQSKDYPWRNAIFRDLILRDWPVFYPKYNGSLVYYIGLWLPPSLLGKIGLLFGASEELSFTVGNISLLVYSAIGISIIFSLILLYIKPKRDNQMYITLIMFIFFSGMDILGSIEPLGANNYHLEWWAVDYQYSSFTTCMCWVFNQAIIPWVCTLLVLKEKNVSNYVLIGMSCLFSGPFPFVGLFIYCIINGIYNLICSFNEKRVKCFGKEVFSISNTLCCLLIFPFIGIYLLSNDALIGSGGVQIADEATKTVEAIAFSEQVSWLNSVFNYLKFILAEFLFVGILIFGKYKKNYIYYSTMILLLIFPFIKMGYALDFTMRASIPSLLILYLLSVKYLFEEKEAVFNKEANTQNKNVFEKNYSNKISLKKYSYILLVACLILGAFTPAVEFIRGFRQVSLYGIDDIMTDYLYTLSGESEKGFAHDAEEYGYSNFVCTDINNKVFFKYLAK